MPSFTLKVKVAYGLPVASVAGVKIRFPPSMSDLPTSWFTSTAVPPSASAPAVGSVAIFTFESAAPASSSSKLKSPAPKAYAVFARVVTEPSDAVGGSFTSVMPIVTTAEDSPR